MNPARRRRTRRRRHYRYSVGHVVRRIRVNPGESTMAQIGGVVAGQLAFSVVNGLVVSKIVTGSTSFKSAGTRTAVSMGLSAGIGFGGYLALRRKFPNLALGVAAAAAVAVVTEGMLAAGLTILGATSAATNTAAATQASTGTGAGAGTGGTGGTGAGTGAGTGGGTGAVASNTGTGTGSTGTSAYLGRMKRRKMRAYLGAMRRRKMAQYLQPGAPATSLLNILPTRKTFGRGAGLGNIYTGGGAFRNPWRN
jgi:hypothetical protein